jgi:hypothetical protein
VIEVTLTRYYSPLGTHGILATPIQEFRTIERPWLNNRKNVSCIPEGNYTCESRSSGRHGETFEIMDVSGRTHILFHKGNKPSDVEGCIAIGRSWGIFEDTPHIFDSYNAFNYFMGELGGESIFALNIRAFSTK